MKQHIYYIMSSCLLLGSLLFTSCSDDDEKEDNAILTETSVYFENSGVNNYVVYDKGEGLTYTFELGIHKAGKLSNKASVTLEVVMTSELNAYNIANGTDFVRLAPKYYEIENLNVSFDANEKDVLQKVKVNFNVSEMEAVADNKVLAIKIKSASVSIDDTKSICIIRPQINQSVFRLGSPQTNTINVDIDNPESYEYNIATILDIDQNDSDVDLEVEADESFVTKYNQENATNFVLAPSNSYELETSKTLLVGDKTISFNLKGSTQNLEKNCILPIRLKSSSIYNVDQDDYFVLIFNVPQYNSELLSRTNWTIVDFNTQEAVGESSGNNGKAIHAIDGNNQTFWHSQWSGTGAFPALPHWLVIDMQDEYTLTSIALRQRGSGDQSQTREGEFYMCKDYSNPDWVKVGAFQMQKISDDQSFSIARTTGRYLKVVITRSYKEDKDNTTSLSEIKAYGYKK